MIGDVHGVRQIKFFFAQFPAGNVVADDFKNSGGSLLFSKGDF